MSIKTRTPHLAATAARTALAACAVAAGLCCATAAHADSTQYVQLLYVSGTTQGASFSDVVASAGSFTDDYVFSSPPPLSSAVFTATAGSGISFSSVQLLTYGTLTVNPISGSFSATAFSESANPLLNSAVYVLEVKGVATAGATYSGTISATVPSAVPEPASWALLLCGGAGLALRRRGSAARPARTA